MLKATIYTVKRERVKQNRLVTIKTGVVLTSLAHLLVIVQGRTNRGYFSWRLKTLVAPVSRSEQLGACNS